MKLPLTYYGNPVLRKKTRPITEITDEIRQLVQDMDETLIEQNGWGLAAPQVNHSIALFIARMGYNDEEGNFIRGELRVFINPKIISYSEELWPYTEGCLSIPGIREEVARPYKVVMQATDLEGKLFEEEFTEFNAKGVMHENDHLNGVLFIDRLSPKKKKELDQKLRQIKKKYA